MDEFLNNYLKIMEERIKMAMIEDHIIHGYMIYRCQHCGAVYFMNLEEGLEDPEDDKLTGEHKPVPFAMPCIACGGECQHIMWSATSMTLSKNHRSYKEMVDEPNTTIYRNFFWNDPESDCGVPIVFEPDFLHSTLVDPNFFKEEKMEHHVVICGDFPDLATICQLAIEKEQEMSKVFYDQYQNREKRRHGPDGKDGYKRPKSNKKLYEY